jgi:hypothetical protein
MKPITKNEVHSFAISFVKVRVVFKREVYFTYKSVTKHIGLGNEKEASELLHLEHSFIWC